MLNGKSILVTGGTGSFGSTNSEWLSVEQIGNLIKLQVDPDFTVGQGQV
jgi:FlaA1/EpsC-like NDP-sugar epimerase